MARLRMSAMAVAVDGNGAGVDDWLSSGSASSTIYRSNGVSTSTPAGGRTAIGVNLAATASAVYFVRAYMYWTAYPTSLTPIAQPTILANNGVSVKMTTSGTLQLWNDNGAVQIGSDSVVVPLNEWHRLEWKLTYNGSSVITGWEGSLDGIVFATTSSLSLGSFTSLDMAFGAATDVTNRGGAAFWSDIAVNDGSGANQNSYPGEGHVGLMVPISDNAIAAWTGGAGGTTNLWDAVNNKPPVGKAAASETNLTQIKNSSTTVPSNYDANLAKYTDAVASGGLGMPPLSTISLVQLVTAFGSEQTSTDAGSVLIVSNPVQATADVVSFSAFGIAVGTYPSDWVTANSTSAFRGSIQYNPTVTTTVAPVIRITKTQSQARMVDVCFLGLLVEWVEVDTPRPIGADNVVRSGAQLQAVNRAAIF